MVKDNIFSIGGSIVSKLYRPEFWALWVATVSLDLVSSLGLLTHTLLASQFLTNISFLSISRLCLLGVVTNPCTLSDLHC